MTEELTEWCMGLPLTQRRKLDEAERQKLQRQVTFLHRCGVGLLLIIPACAVIVCIVAWATSLSVEETKVALAVGGIILGVIISPLLLLGVRDIVQRRKSLQSDLSAQSVKRFAGVFTPDAGGREFASRLRQARFAPNKATGEWSIEVLAASGRVWRVQDQPVRMWITVPIVELAQTPPIASIASQWLQPVSQGEQGTILGGQREMSHQEREELRRYARRLWLRPLPTALGLTLWLSVLAGLMLSQGHLPPDTESRVNLALLACLTLITDAHLAASLRLSRRMCREAQAGRVVIVQMEHAAGQQPSDVVEVLPLTRRQWTIAGRPAPWRAAHTAQ